MLGLKPDEYSGAALALDDPRRGKDLKPVIGSCWATAMLFRPVMNRTRACIVSWYEKW